MKDPFETFDGEYRKFERIEKKLSTYQDLHAFLLLEQICPSDGTKDIVAAAGHDMVWLNINVEEFLDEVTTPQLCDLHRCGIFWDGEFDSLAMHR